MKSVLLILLFLCAAWAKHPAAFAPLGAQLETELEQLTALSGRAGFERAAIDAYAAAQGRCFDMGFALDAALASQAPAHDALRADYLNCLRGLQKMSAQWQHRYYRALAAAMDADETETFEALVTHGLEPLKRPSLRQRVLGYYEGIRPRHKIAVLEAMRKDARIEVRETEPDMGELVDAFEKDRKVLSAKEAYRSGRRVIVSAVEQGKRYVFYAKNRNIYPVTVTLELKELQNFRASKPLPLVVELAPNAEKRLLAVDTVDPSRAASMRPRYSWVMGSLNARHSDPAYRLPFALGTRAVVTQGFNGGVTHRGLGRYAVDFRCPEGTKIYAARGGLVVAAESRHRRGGFDKRYRSEANYVIIEHSDHTFGRYYHLKPHGVTVRVGERVRTGQLIGYSGNTGYSSGPHLHFTVSSVDPKSKKMPITVPFRFRTGEGVVAAPRNRDIYDVVKVYGDGL